jgi:PAS domain S-box-containing protein
MARTARIYLALLILAAVGLLAWWLAQWGAWPTASPVLVATLLLFAVAAQHFPLEIAPGYKVTASSAAYFAALLVFGPPATLVLIGVGQLLGGLGLFLRRDPASGRRLRGPMGILFNAAQLVLAFGLGGLITAAALPHQPPAALDARLGFWAILGAATIHMVNTGAVAVMAGLQRRQSALALWWAGQRAAILEAVALFSLGLAMALLSQAGAVAPALLAPPLALLHWALLHARHLREEATRTAAELRAALEAVEQGVLLTDTEGRVRYANRRLGVFLGVDAESLPGQRWSEIVAAEVVPRLRDPHGVPARFGREVAAGASTERGEIEVVVANARTLAYFCGPVRDPAGAPVGRVEVYEDVTAARQLTLARQEFLMMASHELRTPLTTLGGFLELLARHLDRSNPPDTAQMVRHVAMARAELGRLRQLSEDLVAAARLRAGHLAVARGPHDLAELVQEAVERFAIPRNVASRKHRIICQIVGPLPGEYDAARLEQVLSNLLSNALKYSPNDGEVVVTAQRAGEEARISVRDHGIGVAEEEREKLFLPFYRAENAGEGSMEGLGLGLAISKDIVEAHGGRVWMEPAPGGGSIFQVALPLSSRVPPTSPTLSEQITQPLTTVADDAASRQPPG